MAPARTLAPEHAFAYTVPANSGDARVLASLVADGDVTVHSTHRLVSSLRPALAPRSDGTYTVPLRLVHYLLEADLILDNEVLRSPPSWSIRCRRLGALFEDLDAAGFQWPAISDSNITVAAARLRAALRPALAALTIEQRSVTSADVISASVALPDPLQMLTAKRLRGTDADLDVWVQFRAVLSHSFAPDDISGSDLQDIRDTILEVCGGEATRRLIVAAQAARIANTFESARAPASLVFYAPEADCLTYLLRLQDPPESRFAYLLKLGWRTYATLDRILPHAIDGPSAVRLISEAAVQLGVGHKLSDAGVVSLCNALGVHLPDLELSEAASASNEERMRWMLRQHAESTKSKTATGGGGGTAKGTDAQWNMLYADTNYQRLYTTLTSLDVAPLDLHAVAREMMKAEHPAGLVFLVAGDTMRQPLWKKFSGITPSLLDAVISGAMRVDGAGQPRPEWGPILEPGTAKKLVQGNFELRGAAKLDLWKCCLFSLIRHRDGEHVAARFPTGAPAHGVLLDPEMMRIAQDGLRTAFAAVGYVGSRRLTFASILATIHKRVTTLSYLPDAVPQKEGLVAELEDAVLLLFDDAAAAHKAMVKTAAPFARRACAANADADGPNVIFAPDTSSGIEKMKELDDHLDRVLEDLRLEPSLRKSAALRTVSNAGEASTPLQIVMRRGKRPLTNDNDAHRKRHLGDTKATPARGDFATRNGVYSGDDGVLFGIKVSLFTPPNGKRVADFVAGLDCVGRVAPGEAAERARWCSNRRCDGTHARPRELAQGVEWCFASELHANEEDVVASYPVEHVAASAPGAAAQARQNSRRRSAASSSRGTSRAGGRAAGRGRGGGRSPRGGQRGNGRQRA